MTQEMQIKQTVPDARSGPLGYGVCVCARVCLYVWIRVCLGVYLCVFLAPYISDGDV